MTAIQKAPGIGRIGQLLTGSRARALQGRASDVVAGRTRANAQANALFKSVLTKDLEPASSRKFVSSTMRNQALYHAEDKSLRAAAAESAEVGRARRALGAGLATGAGAAAGMSALTRDKQAGLSEITATVAQHAASKSQRMGQAAMQASKAAIDAKPLVSRSTKNLGGVALLGTGIGLGAGEAVQHRRKTAMFDACLRELSKMAEPKASIHINPDGSFTLVQDGQAAQVDRDTLLAQFPELAPPQQTAEPDGLPVKRLLKTIGKSALGLSAGYVAGVGLGHAAGAVGRRYGVPDVSVANKIAPAAGAALGAIYPVWKGLEQRELMHGSQGSRNAAQRGVPGQ